MAVGKTVGNLYTANHVTVIGTEKLEVETAAGVSGGIDVDDVIAYGQSKTVDTLTSDSETLPLSAKQGKALKTAVDLKAPINNPTFTGNVVVPEADADNEAINKGQMDTADEAIISDEKAIAPQISFNKRVLSDGGTIRSKAFMQRVFEANKDLLSDTKILLVPQVGSKITGGYIEKPYDLSPNNNDATSITGGRFYAGGTIAPSEKLSIKLVQGETGTKSITFEQISIPSSGELTILLNINITCIPAQGYGIIDLGLGTSFDYSSAGVVLNTGGVSLINSATTPPLLIFGIDNKIEIQYKGGNGYIAINGVKCAGTVNAPTAPMLFDKISVAESNFYGTISYFQIISRTLSAYESQNLHRFLADEFPAIETIAVGSQQVATSNLTLSNVGGVTIPEVQDDSAWAVLSTPAWSHYDNSAANGAIYGKLYNGFAVPAINTYAPKGYHVPSVLEWTMLSDYLGGNTVSGGKLKALYGGFDNALATNESGVSSLAGGSRSEAGLFSTLDAYSLLWATEAYLSYYDSGSITRGEASGLSLNRGYAIRLFSNTPHLETDTYTSGLFATDIASSSKSIRIAHSCKTKSIKFTTTTNVTNIEAKLYSYGGAQLETLITGKSCNNTTKVFDVNVDQTLSYTDAYIRITASGNSGSGMTVDVKVEVV